MLEQNVNPPKLRLARWPLSREAPEECFFWGAKWVAQKTASRMCRVLVVWTLVFLPFSLSVRNHLLLPNGHKVATCHPRGDAPMSIHFS